MTAEGHARAHWRFAGGAVSDGHSPPVLLLAEGQSYATEIERLLDMLAVPLRRCAGGTEALRLLNSPRHFRCLVSAAELPDMSAIELLTRARAAVADLPVIIVVEDLQMTATVQAMRAGAYAIIDAAQLRSGLLRHLPGLTLEPDSGPA